MRLYPKVVVVGQSFVNVKSVVIPSQSMSLQEIINRFTRREALPIEKNGIYNEFAGDLEKMAREDITERHERAAEMKARIAKAEKKKAKIEATAKAKADQEAKDKQDLDTFRKTESASSPNSGIKDTKESAKS